MIPVMPRRIPTFFLILLAAAAVCACGSGGGGAGSSHPAGWAAPDLHGVAAKTKAGRNSGFASCQTCHGIDLRSGSASIGCFACHGGNSPHPAKPWRGTARTHTNTDPGNAPFCSPCHRSGLNSSISPATPQPAGTPASCFNNTLCHGPRGQHPSGWSNPDIHGSAAKTTPGSTSGLAYCQECHGNDFSGGGTQVSCSSCHGVNAPHPAKPWIGATRTHITTDPGNAAVCGLCHTNGANSSLKPSQPPPSGSPAGCFNSTLCHGQRGQHPPGWSSPDVHGASAKSAPGNASGFAYCQVCHGNDYRGGSVQVACSSCHGVNAPHPAKPWIGAARTHISTDPGNAAVCGLCHTNGANSSLKPSQPPPSGSPAGCFNSTLCHGPRPAHPQGWSGPDIHGSSAKKRPDAMNGFPYCQACHGINFSGGNVQVSCLNISACHMVTAPHSPRPWRGSTRTHTTTDPGNAVACGVCHQASSTIPGATFDCFNNSLCHGPRPAHQTGWANPDLHGTSAKAAPGPSGGFSNCQACHGSSFSGGSVLVTCLSTAGCHKAAAPHSPKPWRGGTRTHTTTDPGNAVACGLCHRAASAPPSTASGCFNNTLCHGDMQHPAGWATGHALTARSGTASCGTTSCHGTDYTGGAVGISCYGCHLGGPAPGAGIMHPNRWNSPKDSHDGYLEGLGKNASSCAPAASPKGVSIAQYCHGAGLTQTASRVAPPNASWGQAPSCYSCHGKEWSVP